MMNYRYYDFSSSFTLKLINLIMSRFWIIILVSIVVLSGCKKDKTPEEGLYSNGVFVINEGNYGSDNGSVSFHYSNGDSVSNDIFSRTNNFLLGDVVQSMSLHNNRGYICVNVSGKVEVVDPQTMESLGTINDVPNPRYFLGINNSKAYVSSWDYYGSSEVSVIDLDRMEKTASITTSMNRPEKMFLLGGKAYIPNKNDATIVVINTAEDVIEEVIATPPGPSQMVLDEEGKIWVLCGGKTVYNPDWTVNETESMAASIIRLDPSTTTILEVNTFPTINRIPSNLSINPAGNKLFYLESGQVMEKAINTVGLSNTPTIESSNFTSPYGLGINPADGTLYVADDLGFTGSGVVYRYQLDGTLLGDFQVGIGPTDFVFVD